MGEKGRARERKGKQEYRAILEKKKGRGKRENMTEEKRTDTAILFIYWIPETNALK